MRAAIYLTAFVIVVCGLFFVGGQHDTGSGVARADDYSQIVRLRFQTTLGPIAMEVYPQAAPAAVSTFLARVRDGKFDGVMIDTVAPSMITASPFLPGFIPARGWSYTSGPQLPVEADNGLLPIRGAIWIGINPQVNGSTGSQRFNISVHDLTIPFGHPSETMPYGIGVTVIGRVTEGMDVVDAISNVPTGPYTLEDGNVIRHVPLEPVTIGSWQIED